MHPTIATNGLFDLQVLTKLAEQQPETSERPNNRPENASCEERDEADALREAMPDLARLARYERRVWSRRKRAIRALIEIKSRKGAFEITTPDVQGPGLANSQP